nr:unnamed protein product [Callosobruchus analis]
MDVLETQKTKLATHRIFSAACTLSQLLCIQPWYDNRKNEFKWPLGYQLYSLLFGFGVISGLGLVLYRSERKTVNEVDGVLTGLNTTMLVLLVAILVLGSNLNRYSWKFLLTEIGNLTSALVEEKETTHVLDEFYLQFCLGHVMFVGTVIFVAYFVQYDHMLSIYCLLTEFIVEYYCFIATTVISNFIILTKWKYRNIVKALDDIDIKAGDLEKALTQIVSIGQSCKTMSELVDCCNRIQGWQVLWLLARAVLQLLRSVNWLIAIGDDFKWPSFMAIVLNALIGLLYSSVYGILLIFGLTYVSYKSEKTSFNKADSILGGINTTILIFLVAVLVLGTNVNRGSWKLLLTEIRDITLSLVEDKEAVPILDEFYLQVIVGHVIFIASATFMSCFAKFSDKYYIVMEYIPEYYCLMATTINNTNQPDKVVEGILSIRQKYLGVSELVDCFNKLQGWQNLWIFVRSVVQLLRSVNWLMHVGDDFTWFSFIAIASSVGVVLGESAYIILCCESATAAGNKVEKTCHKLQENFELTSKAREELFRLAEITKSFAPKFTAANFFVINKGTILGIINIATTYLIVIIQFNDSVKHKSTVMITDTVSTIAPFLATDNNTIYVYHTFMKEDDDDDTTNNSETISLTNLFVRSPLTAKDAVDGVILLGVRILSSFSAVPTAAPAPPRSNLLIDETLGGSDTPSCEQNDFVIDFGRSNSLLCLWCRSLPDLPREDTWLFFPHLLDPVLNFDSGHARFRPTDNARSDAPSLLVAIQDLGYASMGYPQLAGYYARSYTSRSHLDYLQSDVIGKRSAVNEDTAQLVHATLTWKKPNIYKPDV